jgi:hypothetical protein
MADTQEISDNRRHREESADLEAGATPPPPPTARVRDEDLIPHEGLRYIAKLFKALALLLIFMLIAEVVLGLQQDGLPALGMLLVEATRLIVFAGFLWAAGDLAVLLIESNHDLRASRILLGRLNGRMERFMDSAADAPPPADAGARTRPLDPVDVERTRGSTTPPSHRPGE